MTHALLPTTAAAFTPRSSPIVVLDSTAELSWLENTLKTTGITKGGRYNYGRLRRTLEQTLSAPDAIWTLCSLILQRVPDSQLLKGSNWLAEAISNYRMVHIEAYVVHVDLVQGKEMAFKLTPESISELIEYHKDIYLVNTAAACNGWPEEVKLQDEFVNSVNGFVYRTSAKALLNLESSGSGELSFGKSDKAKTAIMGLFPPPPSPSDITSAAQIIQHFPSPTPRHNQAVSDDPFDMLSQPMAPTSTITWPQYGDGTLLSSFGPWEDSGYIGGFPRPVGLAL